MHAFMHAYFSRKEHTYYCSTVSLRINKKVWKKSSSTDGGDGGTWYPQAYRFLKLRHHTHSLTHSSYYYSYYYEKSIIIERTIQYIKKIDRTEMFDDYFPCQKDNCTLKHVRNWFNLFVDIHNSMIIFAK